MQETQPHNGDKEHDLPIEKAWFGQIAPDPTINAQVNKGRKGPYVLPVRSDTAQLPGDKTTEQIERQSGPLPVQYRGKT